MCWLINLKERCKLIEILTKVFKFTFVVIEIIENEVQNLIIVKDIM